MYDFIDTAPAHPPARKAPSAFTRYRRWIFAKGFVSGVFMTVLCALASWPVIEWWHS